MGQASLLYLDGALFAPPPCVITPQAGLAIDQVTRIIHEDFMNNAGYLWDPTLFQSRRKGGYATASVTWAVIPPSTKRLIPVIQDASLEAKNRTAPATSSATPSRRRG